MKRPNVYVTRDVPGPALSILREHCDVEVNPNDRQLTPAELLACVTGRDAVLTQLADEMTAEVMEAAAPTVKVIANYAVGFNNLDLEAANRLGIACTNTPGVLSNAVAEYAWALLFAVARRVCESDRYMRTYGRIDNWSPVLLLGASVTGKTLGTIGTGRIGSAFVKKAKGFDMKLLYNDVAPVPAFEAETGATFVDRDTLLRQSDYVSLNCPILPSTFHMLGAREFGLMKKNAILINTARGAVVDEMAMIEALKSGQIMGAGLDVFEYEPEIAKELLAMDNVVLSPHVASAETETREEMATMCANNILAFFRGETPPNLLNPESQSR